MSEEERMQIAFVNHVKKTYPDLDVIHIPNGRLRNSLDGLILKRMGVQRGVADLFFPSLKFWLELKNLNGRLSKEQKEFLDKRSKEGYTVGIAKSFCEAVQKLEQVINDSHIY